MKSFSQFLDCLIEDELFEGGLSRVYAHTQGRNIGMMTAFRGKDDFPGKSDEEVRKINHARNAELEHSIRGAGYGFKKVRGRYTENFGKPEAKSQDEHSFLIHGKKGHDNGELKHFL